MRRLKLARRCGAHPVMPNWFRRIARLALRIGRLAVLLVGATVPGQLPPPPKPRREPVVQVAGAADEADGQR